MGIYERTEEVLVAAHYRDARALGKPDRPHAGISGSAVYLHPLLRI